MKARGNVLVLFLGGVAVIAIALAGYFYFQNKELSKKIPLTWEECQKTPGAINLTIYPGICKTPDGRQVTQTLTDEEKKKLQPPDETTNWKTYTDPDKKIFFKYPPEYEEQPIEVFGSRSSQEFKDQGGGKQLTLVVYGNYSQKTQKEYQTLQEFCNSCSPEKEIIVDGQKGIQLVGGSFDLFSKDRKSIYEFLILNNESLAYSMPLADQIISTFKFL